MSQFNENPGPSSYPTGGHEGLSSYAGTTGAGYAHSRSPVGRRDSRANRPDSTHEASSYPPSRPISPALSRRAQISSGGGPGHSGHPHPGGSASHRRRQTRTTSISSAKPRYQEAVMSEEDEVYDSEGSLSGVAPDHGSDSDSDDPELQARRAQERDEEASETGSLDPVTLKERQSLINVEHPFGLPIWKPALYRKSRTVTRDAEHALHSDPLASAERHLVPGNIFWTLCFGWWLALASFVVAGLLYCIPYGEKRYVELVYGLGGYLFWPFGKYLEGDLDEDEENESDHEDEPVHTLPDTISEETGSGGTLRGQGYVSTGIPISEYSTITPRNVFALSSATERTPLVPNGAQTSPSHDSLHPGENGEKVGSHFLSWLVFWLAFISIIAPLILLVTLICWALVFTIPMAKLNLALLNYIFYHPLKIRFRAAPPSIVVPSDNEATHAESVPQSFTVKRHRLKAGQAAPSGVPRSTVLLCTYRAVGLKYYKYTVGGVNIFFVNLMPIVFFVIFDNFVLLPLRNHKEHTGQYINAFLAFITSRVLIFSLSLASVIPLSYFIGMAVASISAQSSIGMGAVINATFGSIIEIILYCIALMSGKGRLVEGSIVGSLLAGVLLMPGASMCSGALRKKEQKFNAKSAGVTSTMLIMAIIGTLTPTLFYQTYGDFTLICDGCPTFPPLPGQPWTCRKCFYEHLDPASDPFYQHTVKSLMYLCASILILSYLIGLWFSLRTHASQIWQNPQQLMHPLDAFAHSMNNSAGRMSLYKQLSQTLPTDRPLNPKPSTATISGNSPAPQQRQSRDGSQQRQATSPGPSHSQRGTSPPSPVISRRVTHSGPNSIQPTRPSHKQQPSQGTITSYVGATGYTPFLDSVNQTVRDGTVPPMQLPPNLTADDFTRAVAVATVSALRGHQEPQRPRPGGVADGTHDGGHDAPSWSRTVSASVLLGCTVLYALIAEILVDVVDVVLEGSGISEKFLGVTLFALVPNTTEFMNAISFALNDNIALSMEIGSAYALQVCLLQIPAMVAFSAWNDPKLGSIANTFTLIFPRWDAIAIILSIFLLTYTYIEAKANYYRGSILVLSYIVLTSGFYFAPSRTEDDALQQFSISSISSPSILTALQTAFYSLWSR